MSSLSLVPSQGAISLVTSIHGRTLFAVTAPAFPPTILRERVYGLTSHGQEGRPTFEELKDKVIKHFLRERSMYQTKQSGEIAFKVDRVRQSHVQERAHSKEAGPAEYVALVHAIQEVN